MATFSPTPPSYGKVVGRYLVAVGDGIDADVLPDGVVPTGTVTLTPSVAQVLVANGNPDPFTYELQPITATLDSSGYLTFNGQQGVWLVATDDTNTNPTDFSYTVQLNVSYSGGVVDRRKFDIKVPASTASDPSTFTDLTRSAPIASSSGTAIVQGPPGPVTDLTIGTVTSGSTPSASITGTAPSKRLNLVLPNSGGGTVSLDNAALTGTPTAPTPPASDNNTRIATTAFVQTNIAGLTSATPNTGSVGYNSSTHTWPPRPSIPNGPVEWRSTNDPSAIQPPGMLIGDSWVQHPDAV
ncbi:hypothetical protein ACRAWB_01905 [Leifsonia poae]|uniref:hypothetical protein n=1 Tax=Leifsonia poae TaxID=110933 RepID=UPI003D69603E